mgnify:CR=1 FL=1
MGVVLTIVGLLFNDPILKAIGVPSEVFSEASTYLSIYFWSLIFVMVYNMGSGILRSVGDSKRPLYFLIFSSVDKLPSFAVNGTLNNDVISTSVSP